MKDEREREGRKGAEGKTEETPPLRPFAPSPLIFPPLVRRVRSALRGEVTPGAAALEILRRGRASLARRRERAELTRRRAEGESNSAASFAARLSPEFAHVSGPELLEHFRTRPAPKFLPGFEPAELESASAVLRESFPAERARLVAGADDVLAGRWPLLGFGSFEFGAAPDWLRDPASGVRWPLEYHADVRLVRGDGSDVRVLWELNRLAHLLQLGLAYAATGDEKFSAAFFPQVENWYVENPVGFGPNWACAMEVALRAVNLLGAFQLFRRSPALDDARLRLFLTLFDEHGAHVRRNLEFSYVTTGNHYLSDLVGLFWLGVCLPELRAAREWREFALSELLREMNKQVLPDGADAEASTGYHRLVTELFLYTFLHARTNGVEIGERYWAKLRSMLEYLRTYLRPDGRAPLLGDTDGGRFLPLTRRAADDHAYLLAVGAAAFNDPRFKLPGSPPEELLWLLGAEGLRVYSSLPDDANAPGSRAFEYAGTFVLREGDAYLLLGASGAGLGGRGSHGHNDALSVEVSACGTNFVRDPGTFVYTSDLRERHRYRSTGYHSTVEVDGVEQNATDESQPFRMGDEARPRLLTWRSDAGSDLVVAEHYGYGRLPSGAITHRRAVLFDKRERCWLLEDALLGAGAHVFRFFFHFAPGTRASLLRGGAAVEACDRIGGARLFVVRLDDLAPASLEPRHSSRDYGAKQDSTAACWTVRASAPLVARWALIPARPDEPEGERLALVERMGERAISY